jgi:hypothetical protein
MRLRNAWPYIRGAWRAARKQATRSDRSHLDLFFDMMCCKFKYGSTVSNYLMFNFTEYTDPAFRDQYIYIKDWIKLVNALNPPKTTPGYIQDKVIAYKRYKKYFFRDVLIVAESSDDEIRSFLESKGTVFAKDAMGYAGVGIEKIAYDAQTIDETVARIREHYDMLEEEIIQHPLLDTVSPNAVASFRFTFLKDKGKILMFPLSVRIALFDDVDIIKVGQSSSCVAVDEEGYFISQAVVNDSVFDLDFETRYDFHPITGAAISDGSFQVPYFKEMVDMMMEIMEGEDEYGHMGWDVAVSETGPCVIEGNPWGSYDFYQYYDHVKRVNQGIRPTIEAFMGCKIDDLLKKADRQ